MSAKSKPNGWVVLAIQLALLASLLALWELGAQKKVIDTFFYASPSMIGEYIWKWIQSGRILSDILITLEEMLLGLVIGSALGIFLGVALASNAWLGAIFEPALVLFNAMPRVTLVPLFILWFGFTIWSKVAGAVVLVLFVVFFATYQGIKDVDTTLISNARVLGASRWEIVRHVLIPSALTWIFSSLRSAVGFALIGAVVAEYLGANAGVGYRIQYAEAQLNTAGVFGGLFVLVFMVYIIDNLIRRIQSRLVVWKPPAI
jgi:NitT/TauT family transport system permease protein